MFVSKTQVSAFNVYNIHNILNFYRSSGAYEAIRDSGCLKLPLQRTLRDYTHYVEAKCGFSVEIDSMLKSASKVDTCPEREKCTILLIG